MRDPYEVLGISRLATAEEIKSAYRKLAKRYHPDLNPGDKSIESKFKEVSTAYDILSDADKKSRFDRGEIDGAGNEKPFGRRPGSSGRAGAGSSSGGGFGGFGFDPDDIFEMFTQRSRNRAGAGSTGAGSSSSGSGGGANARRGSDISYTLTVDFVSAAGGATRRVTTAHGKALDVNIPPGTTDGTKLRLRGQGQPGGDGQPSGDAFIEIHVEPHPHFERRGNDVHLELPITLPEALLGASVTVPTIDGRVAVKIPKGANTGTTLRLKGKGIATRGHGRGDQYVRIAVMLPETVDTELANFIERWANKNPYEVRSKLNNV
ncbi:DnaJ C-terminal domain-containing protein [Lacibacterium aquatile]|uniref:DnaJ C-terminal domain-containing protein n=1 Tax=Lacibacterium aquatile TaxID=1168082 RepID=A0ABW5DWH1_9PROT